MHGIYSRIVLVVAWQDIGNSLITIELRWFLWLCPGIAMHRPGDDEQHHSASAVFLRRWAPSFEWHRRRLSVPTETAGACDDLGVWRFQQLGFFEEMMGMDFFTI